MFCRPFIRFIQVTEPNVIVWDRLLHLTQQSREVLTARGLLPEELTDKFQQFEELLAGIRNRKDSIH
jgi:hypothetical protein